MPLKDPETRKGDFIGMKQDQHRRYYTITIIIGLVNDKSEILGENETFCSSPRLSQVWKRVLDSKITLQTIKLKTMTFD